MDGLTEALVDPGKVDIRTASAGPTYAPARNKARTKGKEVIYVARKKGCMLSIPVHMFLDTCKVDMSTASAGHTYTLIHGAHQGLKRS